MTYFEDYEWYSDKYHAKEIWNPEAIKRLNSFFKDVKPVKQSDFNIGESGVKRPPRLFMGDFIDWDFSNVKYPDEYKGGLIFEQPIDWDTSSIPTSLPDPPKDRVIREDGYFEFSFIERGLEALSKAAQATLTFMGFKKMDEQ